MKRSILLFVVFLLSSAAHCFAQQTEAFDIATFQPPKGWQRQSGADGVQFSIEDKSAGAFSLITLFRSVPSLGDSKENFDAAWRTIVKEAVNVTEAPTMQPSADPQGWK
ncbi:MAG: hypothetical protein IT173_10040, partial [Acidobacteria bacterium]|nr:hypothetical protein [Acidobacteriota bacterium]